MTTCNVLVNHTSRGNNGPDGRVGGAGIGGAGTGEPPARVDTPPPATVIYRSGR